MFGQIQCRGAKFANTLMPWKRLEVEVKQELLDNQPFAGISLRSGDIIESIAQSMHFHPSVVETSTSRQAVSGTNELLPKGGNPT